MKADILSLSEFAYLGQISIVIFMTVFLGALYRVLRPGAKEAYAKFASMPLDPDDGDDFASPPAP